MNPRMEYWKVAPAAFKAMSSLEAYLRDSGFDKALLHLVKLRLRRFSSRRCLSDARADQPAVKEVERHAGSHPP